MSMGLYFELQSVYFKNSRQKDFGEKIFLSAILSLVL